MERREQSSMVLWISLGMVRSVFMSIYRPDEWKKEERNRFWDDLRILGRV